LFVNRVEYGFGLLGSNVEKLYFSVLKNGFGLLARKYGSYACCVDHDLSCKIQWCI